MRSIDSIPSLFSSCRLIPSKSLDPFPFPSSAFLCFRDSMFLPSKKPSQTSVLPEEFLRKVMEAKNPSYDLELLDTNPPTRVSTEARVSFKEERRGGVTDRDREMRRKREMMEVEHERIRDKKKNRR